MAIGEGGGTSLMSGTQISAANLTFAKRYAFNNIFGIVTEEEDDEKELKPTEASQGDIEKAIAALDHCMDAKTFNATVHGFSKEVIANKVVLAHANEIKSIIEQSKKDEQNS
jgi:hypothetical protein